MPETFLSTSSVDAAAPTTARSGRRPQDIEELEFEFTRDPDLLHQYHQIYEREFRIVQNADLYRHDGDDEHDQRGLNLVARRGGLCVGGFRMSVKTPEEPHPLPIEMGDFRLADHFPCLNERPIRCCQVGRLCLLPEFRGGDVTFELIRHITRKAVELKLEMFFATAPLLNARAYMKSCKAIGFTDVKIHFDIELLLSGTPIRLS